MEVRRRGVRGRLGAPTAYFRIHHMSRTLPKCNRSRMASSALLQLHGVSLFMSSSDYQARPYRITSSDCLLATTCPIAFVFIRGSTTSSAGNLMIRPGHQPMANGWSRAYITGTAASPPSRANEYLCRRAVDKQLVPSHAQIFSAPRHHQSNQTRRGYLSLCVAPRDPVNSRNGTLFDVDYR